MQSQAQVSLANSCSIRVEAPKSYDHTSPEVIVLEILRVISLSIESKSAQKLSSTSEWEFTWDIGDQKVRLINHSIFWTEVTD